MDYKAVGDQLKSGRAAVCILARCGFAIVRIFDLTFYYGTVSALDILLCEFPYGYFIIIVIIEQWEVNFYRDSRFCGALPHLASVIKQDHI